MKTGSSRLSLAACADKLIADKQRFNKMSSEFLHMAYMFKLHQEHPELVGQDFEVGADGSIVLL